MNETVLADALLEAAWITARIAVALSFAIAILGAGWAYARIRAAEGERRDEPERPARAPEPGSTQRALAMIVAVLTGAALVIATRGEAMRWLPGPLEGLIAGIAACGACASGVLIVWSGRTLGRSFAVRTFVPAPGALVTTGPYAVVRHPFYVSIGILLGAAGLAFGSLTGTAVALALYAATVRWRVALEERALARALGAEFTAYRDRVPRFLPRL